MCVPVGEKNDDDSSQRRVRRRERKQREPTVDDGGFPRVALFDEEVDEISSNKHIEIDCDLVEQQDVPRSLMKRKSESVKGGKEKE